MSVGRLKPVGLVRMNTPDGAAPPDATILVSGPHRGGPLLAAAALHAAGLKFGDMIDPVIVEDPETVAALPTLKHITHVIDSPLLRRLDSRPLARLIAKRNAAFARWGLKQPNIATSLTGRSGQALFRNPRLVMIFRDPVALAERAAALDGLDFTTALRLARRDNNLNLGTARYATIPVLLASYEKAIVKREAFLAELFDFCGLDIDPAAYPGINAVLDTVLQT